MKSRYVVGVGLTITLGVAAWTSQPQDPPQITTLADVDETLYALTLRVSTLEARVASLESGPEDPAPSGADAPLAAAPSGTPIMRVESIETIQPDQATLDRINQLETQAKELDQRATQLTTQAASITISNDPAVFDDGTRQTARRQRDALRHEAGEFKRQARQLREEIHDLSAPRQIIRGWSGKKSVELRTERDLSRALHDVRIGSFVTCKGSRIDADDDSATLLVTSITPVAAPADFVERPGG